MPHGRKTGGRRKGTPNQRTQHAAELLEELCCDPIRGMAEIAANTDLIKGDSDGTVL